MNLDEQFIQWLIENGRTPRLANRKAKIALQYDQWLASQEINLALSRYPDLMNYVGYMQAQLMSVHQINRTLQALSDYYVFNELDNLAFNLRIRGYTQKTIGTQFTAKQLDEIYQCYEIDLGSFGYQYHSDKIILGLMIYQGLELNSLFAIRINDIDFKNARIRIRAHNRRKQRYIPLEGHQILPLQEFLEIRNEIIEEWLWKRKYIAEEQKIITDRLFSPQCDHYPRMHYQYKRLSKEIKKQAAEKLGYEVRKLSHFRQSRICVWIKQFGLRKTQYLAGLKCIMSVERYQKKDLEGLKKAVEKWHPR